MSRTDRPATSLPPAALIESPPFARGTEGGHDLPSCPLPGVQEFKEYFSPPAPLPPPNSCSATAVTKYHVGPKVVLGSPCRPSVLNFSWIRVGGIRRPDGLLSFLSSPNQARLTKTQRSPLDLLFHPDPNKTATTGRETAKPNRR